MEIESQHELFASFLVKNRYFGRFPEFSSIPVMVWLLAPYTTINTKVF